MRMRKKPWAANELLANPHILEPSDHAQRISKYFNNSRPIHMEIGCGRGRFINQCAAKNPQLNYIAIEREPTALATAARLYRETVAKQDDRPSVAFMRLDAAELPDYFMPGEVSRLYINFCDPWPRKKKWAKRRLTHENFLAIYKSLQISEIFFKTDNRILFEFSINQFSKCGWLMQNVSLDLHKSKDEDNIMTEYEEKFSALGPIYRLEAYYRT